MSTRQITAILDAGILKGKIKTPWLRQIKILQALPLKLSTSPEVCTPDNDTRSKMMVFEWREQVGMRTHRYTLREIL